ncbi:MAG: hypothetical protein ACI8RD_003340 [Bacillariaceae sp.]|jgi:hypothetical protein
MSMSPLDTFKQNTYEVEPVDPFRLGEGPRRRMALSSINDSIRFDSFASIHRRTRGANLAHYSITKSKSQRIGIKQRLSNEATKHPIP